MNIIELSKYILLNYSHKSSDGITPMKLQKLLFYIKAWTIVSGNKLVAEEFQRWDYGPVNTQIYHKYKKHGGNPIELDEVLDFHLDESEKELIDFIIENYISFDAWTLSTMTHQEEPWKETSKNEVISDELIYDYYKKQRFSKNFENYLDLHNKPFYALENPAFELDMSQDDADEISTYPSYESYKKTLSIAEHDFELLMGIV